MSNNEQEMHNNQVDTTPDATATATSAVAVESRKQRVGFDDSNDESATKVKRAKLDDDCYEQQGMLLKEANSHVMPKHLQQLFNKMINIESTADFQLLMLVYAVALEMGYCTKEEYLQLLDKLQTRATQYVGFHAENVQNITALPVTLKCSHNNNNNNVTKSRFHWYSMNLIFLWCASAEQEEALVTKLNAVYDGEHLTITLTPPKSFTNIGYSCLLKVADYVQNEDEHSVELLNLDVLTFKLRTELFIPLQAVYYYDKDILTPAAGLALNPTIFLEVFKNLQESDLGRLAQVNIDYREAVKYYRRLKNKSKPGGAQEFFI